MTGEVSAMTAAGPWTHIVATLAVVIGCHGPPSAPAWDDDSCHQSGPISDNLIDITDASGVAFSNFNPDFRGGALTVAELTGDGLLDLVMSDRLGGFAVYRNLGDMRFRDITVITGIAPDGIVHALAAGDIDNDGDADLLLADGGLGRSVRIYDNDGGGRFALANVLPDSGAVEHLLLVDIDDDGRLDVHTSNNAFGRADDVSNRLYLQRAAGFERVPFAGEVPAAASWTATAFDFDGDGDRDIYVANDTLAADFGFQVERVDPDRAVDQLWRNDGPSGGSPGDNTVPVFTDIAGDLGLTAPRSSMGGLLADVDGDARLELFIPDFGANKLLSREYTGNQLTGFRDRAEQYGIRASHRGDIGCHPASADVRCLLLSWGSAFVDFDGDGARELLVVHGPTLATDPPPPMVHFWSDGAGRFVELAPRGACVEGHGLVPADLDRDGDLDLVVSTREGAYRIYENRAGPPEHWLAVRLHGMASNRDGRGAVLHAQLSDGRILVEAVGAGGVAYTSRPVEVFFSAGAATIDEIAVTWPSGRVDRVREPPDAGAITITETLSPPLLDP